VSEAPYCLERLIDNYDHITDPEVKIALLTSTLKLFFQRAPEVQKMLGRLLQKATEDVSSQDLHDRALLYYRLLRTATNPKIVEQIVSTNLQIASATSFSEENIDADIRDELMKEFNTLSIIYGTTCKNFVSEENIVHFVKMPPEHPLDSDQSTTVDNLTKQVEESNLLQDEPVGYNPTESHVAPAVALEADLLGFGPDPTPTTQPSPAPVHSPGLGPLDTNVSISGEEYQRMWEGVSDSEAHVEIVPLKLQPPNTDSVEIPLANMCIKTMASGELPSELKFFLYAKEASTGSFFLVQATVSKDATPCELLLTIKVQGSGGSEKANAFVDTISTALSAYT
jgi:hypothetical protein